MVHTRTDPARTMPGMTRLAAQTAFNSNVAALYATNAHTHGRLTDEEYDDLVAQGVRALGRALASHADRLRRFDAAWSIGLLTDEEYELLVLRWWPDRERLDRCYGHAIGEP